MQSPEYIIAEVAVLTGVPVAAITGPRKTTRVLWARYLAIAAIRQAFDWWPQQEIGDAVRRDHGTIANALQNHRKLLETTPAYRALALELKLVA